MKSLTGCGIWLYLQQVFKTLRHNKPSSLEGSFMGLVCYVGNGGGVK